MISKSSLKQISSTFLLLLLISLLGPSAAYADLIWSAHFADEEEISSSTVITTADNVISFTTAINEDNAGDFSPFSSDTIFSFEGAGQLGNQTQFLEASFNQEDNDPNDFLELQFAFGTAVQDLSFSVLDIDLGPDILLSTDTEFVDMVEIFVNDINVKTNPFWYGSLGSAIALDDETQADGFEGNDEADGTSTAGNLNLDFGGLAVNSVKFTYRSSDDAASNGILSNFPSGQSIGISNLSFNAVNVPEPSALSMLMMLCIGKLASRRRQL